MLTRYFDSPTMKIVVHPWCEEPRVGNGDGSGCGCGSVYADADADTGVFHVLDKCPSPI